MFFVCKIYLSHDVAAIQWITSCHKNRIITRVITLLRNVIDNVRVKNAFSHWTNVYFEGKKNPILKGHMIKRTLHSWSFHTKFMKLAEGSFHKFHMKWPLVQVLLYHHPERSWLISDYLTTLFDVDSPSVYHWTNNEPTLIQRHDVESRIFQCWFNVVCLQE